MMASEHCINTGCHGIECCWELYETCQVRNSAVANVPVPKTEITPELQRASKQGWNMVKSVIFPSLPSILQDMWVYLELFISIIAFVFGLMDIFPIEDGLAFN